MPDFHYAIDAPTRLARVWMTGRVDAEIKLAAIESLYGDPLWKSDFSTIWDCTHATEVIVLPPDVPPLLGAITAETDGMDLFVGDDGLAYLMAKLFALLERRVGKRAHVCARLSDALAHLGLDALPPSLADPPEAEADRRVA
jgi:hypothetical protein